jgi:hypothetical protein
VVAAIFVFMNDRRSRQDPTQDEPLPRRPRITSTEPERPGRRPSMLP